MHGSFFLHFKVLIYSMTKFIKEFYFHYTLPLLFIINYIIYYNSFIIWMFFSITGAIWIGAGIVIVLGLHWSRGTSAGAFSALISGAVIATSAIIAQQIWATDIYPALERAGLLPIVGKILHVLSAPFNPYIVWELNPHKFPINSVEITFFTTRSKLTLSRPLINNFKIASTSFTSLRS